MFAINIIRNDKGNPPGKLADVELHFRDVEQDCPVCEGAGELVVATSGPLVGARGSCAACDGRQTTQSPFAGLKLIGFAIWERRGIQADREGSANERNQRIVTFPARQYTVNGERRSVALLRPIADSTAREHLEQLILDAYEDCEQKAIAESGVSR